MDEFGRKTQGKNDLQLEIYQGNTNFRSYSVNSTYGGGVQPSIYNNFDGYQFTYEFDLHNSNHNKMKRAKTMSSLSKVWCFSDPEFQRKKRVANYRALSLEGKVKGSFRKSFRWLKNRFLYGWW